MSRGTLSLLVGAHQLLVHPIAVILAFRAIYDRWPTWREAVCIAVHDWGYWGSPEMDGPRGKGHPALGGEIAGRLFGSTYRSWCRYHSRHFAKADGVEPSSLCWADKLGVALTPWWLYLPGAWLSGELAEYRLEAHRYHQRTGRGIPLAASHREWFRWVCGYLRRVAENRVSAVHADGTADCFAEIVDG
jgi:hypothetical protein